MRLKTLKRIVSVLCVATMTTACITPSVGAFKAPMNAQVDVVNSVNELNGRLNGLDVKIDQILGATQTKIQTCDANNENFQIKLVTLLSNLEISKQYVKELKDVVVNDSEFAKILKDKVDEANNSGYVIEGEIRDENNPGKGQILFDNTYFDFANTIREKLEDIKKMIKENADDLNKLKSEFYSKRKEFYVRWNKHVEYRKSINKDKDPDSTYGARHAAENFSNGILHNLNVQSMKQAIKYFDEAIDSMNKFESDNNSVNLTKEFYSKRKEFFVRWDKHVKFRKLINKDNYLDPTYGARHNAENFSNGILHNLNVQNMKQAIKYFDEAINSMDKFQNDNVIAFQYMNMHGINQFLGNHNVDNNMAAIDHDKALMKKLKDAWNSHVMHDGGLNDTYSTLDDLKKVLESDSFKDKKVGAEFLADLIDSSNIDGGAGAWLFDEVIIPVLPDEIKEFKSLCINKCGKNFVSALGDIDQNIDKVLKDTPHTWLWQRGGLCGIVNNIFRLAFDKVTDDCYKNFRNTGNKEWSPLEVDLAKLDNMISTIEKKRKSMKPTEFAASKDLTKVIANFKEWFLGRDDWPKKVRGIYENLTGRNYLSDVDQDKNYKGKYVVLKNLYDSLMDLAVVYSNADDDGIEAYENDIKEQIEEIKKASRHVVEFFTH